MTEVEDVLGSFEILGDWNSATNTWWSWVSTWPPCRINTRSRRTG